MTSRDKLLTKLENQNSDANWTLAEVKQILQQHGWVHDRTNGSHLIFAQQGAAPIVVATHGKKVKKGYIKIIRQNLLE